MRPRSAASPARNRPRGQKPFAGDPVWFGNFRQARRARSPGAERR